MTESKRRALVGRVSTNAEWAAIAARQSEPRFLFLVTRTGIICTPGCPAHVPGSDRVRGIGEMAEGLAAGARACLHCHPDRVVGAGGRGSRGRSDVGSRPPFQWSRPRVRPRPSP